MQLGSGVQEQVNAAILGENLMTFSTLFYEESQLAQCFEVPHVITAVLIQMVMVVRLRVQDSIRNSISFSVLITFKFILHNLVA